MENHEELGIESALEKASSEGTIRDAAWYGLLFGVLACGCQFSDTDTQERILRARVFGAILATYRYWSPGLSLI